MATYRKEKCVSYRVPFLFWCQGDRNDFYERKCLLPHCGEIESSYNLYLHGKLHLSLRKSTNIALSNIPKQTLYFRII
jgi:hypothetical protein